MTTLDLVLLTTEVLVPITLAMLWWALAKLARYVDARWHNERLNAAVQLLNEVVATVVAELYQTTVSDLKAAAADGRLTPAERMRLQMTALNTVRRVVGHKALDGLVELLGLGDSDLVALLKSKIEAAVFALHRVTDGAPPAAPPSPPVHRAPPSGPVALRTPRFPLAVPDRRTKPGPA